MTPFTLFVSKNEVEMNDMTIYLGDPNSIKCEIYEDRPDMVRVFTSGGMGISEKGVILDFLPTANFVHEFMQKFLIGTEAQFVLHAHQLSTGFIGNPDNCLTTCTFTFQSPNHAKLSELFISPFFLNHRCLIEGKVLSLVAMRSAGYETMNAYQNHCLQRLNGRICEQLTNENGFFHRSRHYVIYPDEVQKEIELEGMERPSNKALYFRPLALPPNFDWEERHGAMKRLFAQLKRMSTKVPALEARYAEAIREAESRLGIGRVFKPLDVEILLNLCKFPAATTNTLDSPQPD